MRAVIQRVSEAAVEINGEIVGHINRGLVVLLGINHRDDKDDVDYLIDKIVHLRIFQDNLGKMNLSLREVDGAILVISQFTLYANTRKGRRPSFIEAAQPVEAEKLYQNFIESLKQSKIRVSHGQFGAMMLVKIFNEGPVTIILDSEDRHKPRK